MVDNEFGYTKWGMDWVRLAEPIRQTRPEPLLPRARSIARNNGVQTTIEGPIVRAHIHRGGRASVTHIEVAPLTRTTITAIAELISPHPVTLTDDMHRALVAAGITAAPALAAVDCSCPARTAHCLHVLAAFYDIARQIDELPRLALDLQGFFQSTSTTATTAPTPDQAPHWAPINVLDPATFFTAPTT